MANTGDPRLASEGGKVSVERQPVTSSNVASIGYDGETETLEVGFVKGTVYQYQGVPQSIYEEFVASSSKGSYLNRVIKVRFVGTRVE